MSKISCYKLTLRDNYEVLKEVESELLKRFEGQFNICFSDSTILEVMPLGVSKAMALVELRDMLSEDGSKKLLYTVGDYENDIEMHELADVSVCPANAIDKVKDICDIKLCDNDSGVIADLIELLDKK
jgi:hydroxymethylpyrimidine pyrophosphatase-like HAD family hydrolase